MMSLQDAHDFISQQWVLHADDIQAWISYHSWTLVLIAGVILYLWIRDQKRQGKI
jgi:hypothetical protein